MRFDFLLVSQSVSHHSPVPWPRKPPYARENQVKLGRYTAVSGVKSDYGSEGWGFESLRACFVMSRDIVDT